MLTSKVNLFKCILVKGVPIFYSLARDADIIQCENGDRQVFKKTSDFSSFAWISCRENYLHKSKCKKLPLLHLSPWWLFNGDG